MSNLIQRLRNRTPVAVLVAVCLCSGGSATAQCPTGPITSFPWVENFDAFGALSMSTVPPLDWEQSIVDNAGGADADWYFLNADTITPGTGPSSDHSSGVPGAGFFAYVEDSGGNHASVALETPCLDLQVLVAPTLRFWLHSKNSQGAFGTNENPLSIDVVEYPGGMGPPIEHADVVILPHQGPEWRLVAVDLSAFQGSVVRIRFDGRSDGGSFTHDCAIDDVVVSEAQPFDVGVSSIDGPNGVATCGTQLSVTETVTITITNFGTSALTSGQTISVSYDVNGGTPIVESATTPAVIATGESFTHVFAATADLAFDGIASLHARSLDVDADATNDAAETSVIAGVPALVTQFPWAENFDVLPDPVEDSTTPPPCFEQDPSDGGGSGAPGDWLFRSIAPATPGTGPSADHTTALPGQGRYAYVDDASEAVSVRLLTPLLDLSQLTTPLLSFWMHSFNAGPALYDNMLSIDVVDAMGSTIAVDVLGPLGPSGANWTRRVVDLSIFGGQTIRIAFRVDASGGWYEHDVAIDDVSVYQGVDEGGWPPQPGAAVLDMNGARNLAGFPVADNPTGIFYAAAAAGGSLALHFEGEPTQPIILISGMAAPGNHTYPSLGGQQFDIGGPFDPFLGVPTGLTIVVSGLDLDLLSSFFRIGVGGSVDFLFSVPVSLSGFSTTYQAVLFNSTTIIRFSNAVQLDVD